jgi:hypothetical protein
MRRHPFSSVRSWLSAKLLTCVLLLAAMNSGFSASPGLVLPGEEITYDEKEGQALVEELLSQVPPEMEFSGLLKLRSGRGERSEIPVRYTVEIGENGWRGTYLTQPTLKIPAEQLVVVHRNGQPNQYIHTQLRAGGEGQSKTLVDVQAAIPFAGSDYWLTDLGLEFLHWPVQRLIRNAKITMRQTRPCKVLESVNPKPQNGGYTKVLSWIDNEYGVPIFAEAYGPDGKQFKIFSLKGFKKVNGQWQPKDMVIQNERTDSRTALEFKFETRLGDNSQSLPGTER